MKASEVIELQQFKIRTMEAAAQKEREELGKAINEILAIVSPKARLYGYLDARNLRIIRDELKKEFHMEYAE